MISFFVRLWRDRRGNALVIAAAALPLVIGSAGLASDTIEWALWKRQLQRAADSAAMAGVYSIVEDSGDRTDVTTAVDHDLTYNNHVGITTTKAYVGQPTSGTYSSDAYAVQVKLQVQKKLSFSGMFMSTAPTVTATATATVVPSGHYCVVSLEDTSATGITASGNATVNMGCGMITNSTSLTAAVATGSSTVTATPIAAVGGIDASDNWGTGTVLQPFTVAQEDPYGDIDPPTPSGCKSFSTYDTGNNNKPGGTVNLSSAPSMPAGGTYCLKENSGTLTIAGNVTLPSGTYVLDATSIKMTNTSASLTCHDCVFILTSSSAATNPGSIGTVSLQGGKLDITNRTVDPYKGLMFYQDRRAQTCTSSNCQNLINGNSSSSLQGSAYFPSQKLTFNGTAGMTTNCLQLVARDVSYSGNMNISNTCSSTSGAHDFTGKRVRLVA